MENKNLSISEKVRNLFLLKNERYKCTLAADCHYAPKSLVITNCLRHIKDAHHDSYNILQLGKQLLPDNDVNRNRKKRARVDDEYATVRVSKQRLMGGILKMFTVHGVAFRGMSWEGFREIIDPLLDAFHLTINEHNIVQHIKNISGTIDTVIREELKDKLVSIKFDTTSKMNRSVLAVSAQYYKELKLERRSLGKCSPYNPLRNLLKCPETSQSALIRLGML